MPGRAAAALGLALFHVARWLARRDEASRRRKAEWIALATARQAAIVALREEIAELRQELQRRESAERNARAETGEREDIC